MDNTCELTCAASAGDIERLKRLLCDTYDVPRGVVYAAARFEQLECLQRLLMDTRVDVTHVCNWLVRNHIHKIPTASMKMMLQHPQFYGANDTHVICGIIKAQRDALLQVILDRPDVDPTTYGNKLLFCAVMSSDACFKTLLQDPRVDPIGDHFADLWALSCSASINAFVMLVQHPRVQTHPFTLYSMAQLAIYAMDTTQFASVLSIPNISFDMIDGDRIASANIENVQMLLRHPNWTRPARDIVIKGQLEPLHAIQLAMLGITVTRDNKMCATVHALLCISRRFLVPGILKHIVNTL